MAQGDIKFLTSTTFGLHAAQSYQCEANTAVILPGEPVVLNTGARNYVLAASDGDGVIGTDVLIGIAENTSTQTATVDGKVSVHTFVPGIEYRAAAKSAAAVDTQAEYDLLVGKRVVLDLTGGVYTIDTAAADSASNAILIRDLDIQNYPGQVAFEVLFAGTLRS